MYKFTWVWYSAKQDTTHRLTTHLAHLYTVLYLWPQEEHRQQHSWMDDFAGLRYVDSRVAKHFLIPNQCQQPEFHWWLCPRVWFFPRPLQWTPKMVCLIYTPLMTGHSCSNLMPPRYECVLQWQKTDLKLQCDYCIKFQLFKGAQDVSSRLMAAYCMLLPRNPYRLPQHYMRHVCGSSCSCKHRFFWISPILDH